MQPLIGLDQALMEMRWRCLSLAADLDRLDRLAKNGSQMVNDPRLGKLRSAIAVLLESKPDRAERVQIIFSDMTPGPR